MAAPKMMNAIEEKTISHQRFYYVRRLGCDLSCLWCGSVRARPAAIRGRHKKISHQIRPSCSGAGEIARPLNGQDGESTLFGERRRAAWLRKTLMDKKLGGALSRSHWVF